mgnify:CR=1 FL=1
MLNQQRYLMMTILYKSLVIILPSWLTAYISGGIMAWTLPVIVAMTIIVSNFDNKPKVDDDGGTHE